MAHGPAPRPLAGDRLRRLRGLKARLAFILGVVLVPALLYSVWQAVNAYTDRQAQQAQAVSSLLRLIAGYETEFLERTRTLLLRLAALPEVGGIAQPACGELLRRERQRGTDYHNFVAADREGTIRCSSSEGLIGQPLDPRSLEQLRRGAAFAVSEVMERPVGSGQTMVAVVPIQHPEEGGFGGALAAFINLQSFQRVIDGIELPAGGVAYLVDGEGRALAETSPGYPAAADGTADRGLLRRLLQNPAEPVTVQGMDGVRRDYHAAEVAGGDLFVIAGIPSLPRFAWLQRELVIGVFAPTLMLALAMVTVWIATDYLVIRHLRTLGAAARAYSRGELDLRLDFAAAPAEFQELAHTLARMAARVRRREEELRASLAQKDLLLREVHHRVKNNLQVVTSLLNLRAQRLQAPAARDAVRQAQMRIAAMTLVHRKLYETDDIQTIELGGLLEELCAMLEEMNDSGRATVLLSVKAQPAVVLPDQAIPIALLVTEAVSNAFRHAFPGVASGRVDVRLACSGPRARLVVADDGIGLAGGEGGSGGMGATLMRMLAKQIRGALSLKEDGGTRVELEFPLPELRAQPLPAAAEPVA